MTQKNPNGLCPDCGKPIILYEKNGNMFVYFEERKCSSKITHENLTKKFFLESAPVKRIFHDNSSRLLRHFDNNDIIDDSDLPF